MTSASPSSPPAPSGGWAHTLLGQLTDHYDELVRPHLIGLTDEEYLWEPVGGWSLRPGPDADPAGERGWVVDYVFPDPDPAPFTTIAWRLAHIVRVFSLRNAYRFGGPPYDFREARYSPRADRALEDMEQAYGIWVRGVTSLDEDDLARPVGPDEQFFPPHVPFATIVLHVHREVIHHWAEILVLRDLYRAQVR